MKQYNSYKDSGVEWIGNIPKHWKSKSLKYSFKETKGKIPKTLLDVPEEGCLPYLSMEVLRGATPKEFASVEDGVISQEAELLILWDGSNAGEVVQSKKGIISSTTALLRLSDENLNQRFAYYLLKFFERDFKNNTIGMGIPHVDGNHLRQTKLILPPKEEQIQIASYLDHQTHIIDQLIEKKKLLIEKLKEQRQAVINEAVTKGLDPNVPMKDSGIPWLGEIPEHWEVCKIKHLARLQSGDFISASEIQPDGEFPVMGGNGLRGYTNKFNLDGAFVLIGRQGALCGNINYSSGQTWATEHAIVAYPIQDIDSFFFGELLRAMHLNQYSESAAQPGLAVGKIANLSIPKIPFDEQIEISGHIRNRGALIQESLEKIETQIEKLHDYRQSLISEAVTGKIDLRNWKKPQLY